MVEAYVVTEQEIHTEILMRLLPEHLVSATAFITDEYPAMATASTLLVAKRRPVALVADANTHKEIVMQERLDLLNWNMRSVPGVPFKVLLPLPEVEVVFFQEKRLLERLLGERLSDREWRIARRSPRAFLAEVLGEPPITLAFLARLSEEEVQVLRQHPLIHDLSTFLAAVIREQPQAVAV